MPIGHPPAQTTWRMDQDHHHDRHDQNASAVELWEAARVENRRYLGIQYIYKGHGRSRNQRPSCRGISGAVHKGDQRAPAKEHEDKRRQSDEH